MKALRRGNLLVRFRGLEGIIRREGDVRKDRVGEEG